ncbi:MAG: hypothetical protein IKB16_16150 [Lentisphaeria bacterium]|nr:hypothetical protein [Lentisphaeria bacterium]
MKMMICYGLLPVFLLLTVCGTLPAAEPQVSAANIVSTMEKGLDPFKKHNIRLERLDDPLIATRPVYACHIIFMRQYSYMENVKRKPGEKTRKGKQPVPTKKRVTAREYADIVMIQKDPFYKIENVLKMYEEETQVKGPLSALAYQQFGIQWRKTNNRYKQYTLYLGEDQHNHYFGSANLTVLMWFRRTFGLRNGFPVTKTLAQALTVKDADNLTARYAVVELAKYRNNALNDLRRSITDSTELDEPPYSQFLCMQLINTPEADALLSRYAASSDEILLNGLFHAFSDTNTYRATQKRVFYRMVQTRMAPLVALKAAETLNMQTELIPFFQDYVEKPYSMDDFELGVRSLFRIRHGNTPVPHQNASEQLRDMLLRAGEVKDTLRIYNVQESTYTTEDRLAKLDAERIKPYVEVIVNNPHKDLGLLTALELAVFSPPQQDGFSQKYIRRIRKTGAQILTQFDERAVRTMFRNLIRNVRQRGERALFEDAYSMYSRIMKQQNSMQRY